MTFPTRPDSGEDEGVCSQVQQHQARQVFEEFQVGEACEFSPIEETGLPGSEEEQV